MTKEEMLDIENATIRSLKETLNICIDNIENLLNRNEKLEKDVAELEEIIVKIQRDKND